MSPNPDHGSRKLPPEIQAELMQLAKKRGIKLKALLQEVQRWTSDHPGSGREELERAIRELKARKRELMEELNRLTRRHSNLTGRRSVLRFSCGEQVRSCETLSLALIGLTAEHRRLCGMLDRNISLVEDDDEMIDRYLKIDRKI